MTDSNSDTLASAIKLGIENRLKDLHTNMPGIIVSFDPVTQLASIQPAIRRIFKSIEGDSEFLSPSDLPILINVPVIFPRGGGFSFTFPLVPGDECLLVFNERAIDSWHEQGGVQNPTVKRMHSLSDAVCFIGLSSKENKIQNYDATRCQMRGDNNLCSISLSVGGGVTVIADTAVTLLSSNTNIVGNLHVSGNITSDGTVTNAGVNIGSTHTHAQGNDSNGDSQVPTEVPQ